jgi:hypothetical protein
MQIDLSDWGWKTFGGFAAQSNQFPNYSIFIMNQLRVFMRSYLHQENARIISKTERRCYTDTKKHTARAFFNGRFWRNGGFSLNVRKSIIRSAS